MPATPASLREAADLIARRELSPLELTRGCLERIQSRNALVRAFIRRRPA